MTLQVAPRGPGVVSASPAGVDSDGNPVTSACDRNEGSDSCVWRYPAGATVRLSANADAGKSFAGWSTPDCPGTSACSVTLDSDLTSVVAVFSPLRLGVVLSTNDSNKTNGRVTSSPGGINCHENECSANFAPHTRVTLTAVPDPGHTFKGWNPGCEPTNQPICTITVDDQPTWVGATFDNEHQPQLATTITVDFHLRKSGTGHGSVTASKINCGPQCTAEYDYGKSITLTAKPDDGSTFDGWNGVCSRTQLTCAFAVGPITSISAVFGHDSTPPAAPQSLRVTAATRTSISISWTAASDNIAVTGYRIYVAGTAAGDTTGTAFKLGGLSCGRDYEIDVDAVDAVGNRSAKTAFHAATKACPFSSSVTAAQVRRAGSTRTVVTTVTVSQKTHAQLSLTQNGRSASRRRYSLHRGENALQLRVPHQAPAGAYKLAIVIVVPGGGKRSYVRGVALPPRR